MAQREVWFSPAECSQDCRDRMCPYIHRSGWMCEGVEGLFVSEAAARQAADQLQPRE